MWRVWWSLQGTRTQEMVLAARQAAEADAKQAVRAVCTVVKLLCPLPQRK